ncbi:MAG TPA: class I SAM-dependent methyltransferase [Verrucomicrobiota bacterium]|nr:class I SAM-dependent methyltransferase [Verrucomicrobiota bacterium]
MGKDNRTIERLRHHYEVERELAEKLRHSTRQQRTNLYKTLYDELFQRVPDHPRLTRIENPESLARAVEARMTILRPLLNGVETFLEFAPGDCRLAFEMANYVKKVYAVDISDQSGKIKNLPSNFELIVYDGYNLDLPKASIDLAFSYQFLEHLHPDDVELHLQLAFSLLKDNGSYLISTPHAFSGPHDISVYFSDTPQGFHLKEWTYCELLQISKQVGFKQMFIYRFGKLLTSALLIRMNLVLESALGKLSQNTRRRISRRIFNSVTVLLKK